MSGHALHLPNLTTSPPGEWRYRVPESGQHFHGSNWPELQGKLTAHYNAAGYPLPDDLFERVEAYICAGAQGYCVEEATGMPPRDATALALTFHVVLQGTRTLASWWIKHGRKHVPQEQADKRAAICAMCIQNQEPQGCTACNNATMKDAVSLIIGKRSTPFDSQLKACLICMCNLKGKVHIPHAPLWDNTPDAQRERLPAHCWLLTEQQASTPQTP